MTRKRPLQCNALIVLCQIGCCILGWTETRSYLFSKVSLEFSSQKYLCIQRMSWGFFLRWLCKFGWLGWLVFSYLLCHVVVVVDVQSWGRLRYTENFHKNFLMVSISLLDDMLCYLPSLVNWHISPNVVHCWSRWFSGFASVFSETFQSCQTFGRVSVCRG